MSIKTPAIEKYLSLELELAKFHSDSNTDSKEYDDLASSVYDAWQALNPDEEKLFGLSFRTSLEGIGTSFNCWRGYQAIYKIENDSLFVSSIIDCHSIKKIDILNHFYLDSLRNNVTDFLPLCHYFVCEL
jgi:hypothetical protein